MKRIHYDLCTHHIYIKELSRPIHQPLHQMNLALKDVVKEELHKFLTTNFIYPIFDSQWVSLVVIVPKKNGKWRIYVDYIREINKEVHKGHFPLHFIDEVLDMLFENKYFSFLDGFSGYNQIQNCTRRLRQNNVHLPLGDIFLPCSTIWVIQFLYHISMSCYGYIFRSNS